MQLGEETKELGRDASYAALAVATFSNSAWTTSRQSGYREQMNRGSPARLTRSSRGAPQEQFWDALVPRFTTGALSNTLIQDKNSSPTTTFRPGRLISGALAKGE